MYSLLLLIRERLKPHILAQMTLAHENGTPQMRPQFYDFPDDNVSWEVEDQFLIGPDLLVAPILRHGTRTRKVYCPQRSSWRDAWSETTIEGGNWIETDAPLERIQLYLREDAQLPIRE